ncbi:MAG TPA: glycosyltransferase family 39 protein [Bellilinea sp.]|nr:glycosyltransferase family 39 protein [Bellilinea sp.]
MDGEESAQQSAEQPESDSKEAQLDINLELAPGTRLHVRLNTHAPDGTVIEQREVVLENPATEARPQLPPLPRSAAWSLTAIGWPIWLLIAAVFLYLASRLIGLANFPIFFFTDEAIQTVTASDLLHNGLRGLEQELLPTYFKNGGQYNLSLSVYLQVLPTWLFGKSVFVTRAVSALVSLLAVLGVGLTLKNIFGSRSAWAGVLLLAVTPVWFLHSRTAFETVLAVSFYAAFIYCYGMYRRGKVGYLYAAVVCAALTFYSYSPGQVVIGLTAVLLLLLDWRYHWQQRKTLLRGMALAAVLAIPWLRFQVDHPGETLRHLEILNSYWIQDMSLPQKLARFGQEYLRGLNPVYWFDPTPDGLVRHIMKGHSHLWLPALPFILLGLGLALARIRSWEYRLVLASLVAAPAGAALVGLGVTRLLFMVIPASLLGGIGFSETIAWLTIRWRQPRQHERVLLGLSLLIFVLMSLAGGFMLRDALVNGPTWFDDYGLGGMQYGGDTLFSAVRSYLDENPAAQILLSPSWANGTDVIARFFFDDPLPFRLGSVEGHLGQYIPISSEDIFILLPEELEQVRNSGKFKAVETVRTVNYPNGQPGFYFSRLTYLDNAPALFEQERDQRRALIEDTIHLPDGTTATVSYSRLDMGEIKAAFDGDSATLIRTTEANPFKINLNFAQPQSLRGLRLRVGGVATRVSALVFIEDEGVPRSFIVEADESPVPQLVDLDFYGRRAVQSIQLEILNVRDNEPAHVHLWEVTFR